MKLEDFRKLTAHLPGNVEIKILDANNDEYDPKPEPVETPYSRGTLFLELESNHFITTKPFQS